MRTKEETQNKLAEMWKDFENAEIGEQVSWLTGAIQALRWSLEEIE